MILIGKLLCGFWSQYLSCSSLLVFNRFIFDDFFPRDNRIDLMSKLCFGRTLMFALPCRRTPSSELRSCVVILPEKELDKKCLDSSRFLEVENWNMKQLQISYISLHARHAGRKITLVYMSALPYLSISKPILVSCPSKIPYSTSHLFRLKVSPCANRMFHSTSKYDV